MCDERLPKTLYASVTPIKSERHLHLTTQDGKLVSAEVAHVTPYDGVELYVGGKYVGTVDGNLVISVPLNPETLKPELPMSWLWQGTQ